MQQALLQESCDSNETSITSSSLWTVSDCFDCLRPLRAHLYQLEWARARKLKKARPSQEKAEASSNTIGGANLSHASSRDNDPKRDPAAEDGKAEASEPDWAVGSKRATVSNVYTAQRGRENRSWHHSATSIVTAERGANDGRPDLRGRETFDPPRKRLSYGERIYFWLSEHRTICAIVQDLVDYFVAVLKATADVKHGQPQTLLDISLRKFAQQFEFRHLSVPSDDDQFEHHNRDAYLTVQRLGGGGERGSIWLQKLVRAHAIKLLHDAAVQDLIDQKYSQLYLTSFQSAFTAATVDEMNEVIRPILFRAPHNAERALQSMVTALRLYPWTQTLKTICMLLDNDALLPNIFDDSWAEMLRLAIQETSTVQTTYALAHAVLYAIIRTPSNRFALAINACDTNGKRQFTGSRYKKGNRHYSALFYVIGDCLISAIQNGETCFPNKLFHLQQICRISILLSVVCRRFLENKQPIPKVLVALMPFHICTLVIRAVNTEDSGEASSIDYTELVQQLAACWNKDLLQNCFYCAPSMAWMVFMNGRDRYGYLSFMLLGLVKLSNELNDPQASWWLRKISHEIALDLEDESCRVENFIAKKTRVIEEVQIAIRQSEDRAAAEGLDCGNPVSRQYRWEESISEWVVATPQTRRVATAVGGNENENMMQSEPKNTQIDVQEYLVDERKTPEAAESDDTQVEEKQSSRQTYSDPPTMMTQQSIPVKTTGYDSNGIDNITAGIARPKKRIICNSDCDRAEKKERRRTTKVSAGFSRRQGREASLTPVSSDDELLR